jgi:hypothetical protein
MWRSKHPSAKMLWMAMTAAVRRGRYPGIATRQSIGANGFVTVDNLMDAVAQVGYPTVVSGKSH